MAIERDGLGFPPPHPGAYLRQDILPALDMTITDLADHLQVSRPTLSDLVNEKKSVSVEMAQRLGRAFGNGARFWLALQLQYDLWHAEHKGTVNVTRLKWRNGRAA
jgi:antitoxin HigA-1